MRDVFVHGPWGWWLIWHFPHERWCRFDPAVLEIGHPNTFRIYEFMDVYKLTSVVLFGVSLLFCLEGWFGSITMSFVNVVFNIFSPIEMMWTLGSGIRNKAPQLPDCFVNSLKTLCRVWQSTKGPLLMQICHLSDQNSAVWKWTQGAITSHVPTNEAGSPQHCFFMLSGIPLLKQIFMFFSFLFVCVDCSETGERLSMSIIFKH